MSTLVKHRSQAKIIKEEDLIKAGNDYLKHPNNLSSPLLKTINISARYYFDTLTNMHYSPKKISPQKAESLYSLVVDSEKGFKDLVKHYSRIQHHSFLLNQIYLNFARITDELDHAKECLIKLKDTNTHQSLLDTVERLETSTFLYD